MKAELELLEEQMLTLIIKYVKESLYDLDSRNFGTTRNESADAIFPFVYIENIVATETATDLECDKINGGLFTYQIKVESNVSKAEVKRISAAVTKTMKRLGFRATSLPLYADTDSLHIKIARWQREIHEGDVLDYETS